MTTSKVMSLKDLLRAALRDELPDGWFYLPDVPRPDLKTRVLLVTHTGDLERTPNGTPRLAVERGFPNEGLDTATLVSIAQGTTTFARKPKDGLLLEAFLHYLEHDAFLPEPGAPPPPPLSWAEFERRQDREFYDSLGAERDHIPCREEGCTRGTITFSVLCRPHHFENVKRKPSPFTD